MDFLGMRKPDQATREAELLAAIKTGDIFLLTADHFTVTKISKDKLNLFHDAFLSCDRIYWKYWESSCKGDVQFMSNVIKEHQQITILDLSIHEVVDISPIAQVIPSARVTEIVISHHPRLDLTPLLIALQKAQNVKMITINSDIQLYELKALASAVQNKNLESIKLSNLPVEAWTLLGPIFTAHKSLKTIHMMASYGKKVGLEAMGEILSKTSSIQNLSLDDGQSVIHSRSFKKFCEGLKNNSTLKRLELRSLSKKAHNILFRSLGRCRVSHLKLYMKDSSNAMGVLGKALRRNTTVTRLEIIGCQINTDTLRQMIGNRTIKQLILFRQKLDLAGLQALCEFISLNSSLEVLDLTASFDGKKHSLLIAQLLTKNTSLTSLNLTSNKIGDEGFDAICEAMLHNTTLTSLNLSRNQYGGLPVNLKPMLTQNKTLRHFHMAIDASHVTLVDLFCDGLRQNTTLTSLALESLPLNVDCNNKEFVKTLEDIFEVNYALDTIRLTGFNKTFSDLERRNRQHKSDIRFKIAILSHNIALSSHALTILPREIWEQILSSVPHPGVSLRQLVRDIFDGTKRTELSTSVCGLEVKIR